jgi:hypothetical protein
MKVFWLIGLFIINIAILGTYAMQHEDTHKIYCEYEGGEAQIKYFDLPQIAYTTPCTVQNKELTFLDSINEITGYHTILIIMLLLGLLDVLVIKDVFHE